MTYPAGNPTLHPHEHAAFTVARLKALAMLLASEDVGYSVTNLDGNVVSSLFEIFESGLAEVHVALTQIAKAPCATCGCARLEGA